jgi:oxygen-independent coproporphyrinogen-3 oxidase
MIETSTAVAAEPVRAIYAHVPFCQTICGYCDFFSVLIDKPQLGPLVDALLSDLYRQRETPNLAIETIFVGGGTPTTLPPEQLARLLNALLEFANRRDNLEFTVEANPATVSAATAVALVDCGVNRVSIGAQSFDRNELRVLDRIHHPPQVAETVQLCRSAGIGRINLDLIFAIPGQSLHSWLANLRQAIDLGPDHLSCYGLTYEPGTPLYERLQAGGVQRIDDELEAEMYEATIETLAVAGFAQYEISNFARPGCECRHNLAYWRNEPYLAIGPSGSGYVGGVRYKNIADVAEYIHAVRDGRSARVHEERPSLEQQIRETLMMGLRLNAGIDPRAFRARFGREPRDLFAAAIEKCVALGMVNYNPDAFRLTSRGRLVADAVLAELQ